MPDYVLLLKITEEGARDIADTPHHIDHALSMWEKLGGTVHNFCLTMGEYDFVIVGSIGDEQKAAIFALRLTQQGNLTTTTLRAYRQEELIDLFTTAFPDPPPTYPSMHRTASPPPD